MGEWSIYQTIYEVITKPLVGIKATELERVIKKLKAAQHSDAEKASGAVLEILHRTMMINVALQAETEGVEGQRIYLNGKHYEYSGDSWDIVPEPK